jgi:uncharacterized protein
MSNYTTPGVYVEEIRKFPPSVAQVETAIPAFIGYTRQGFASPIKPVRITSLVEFESLFGKAQPETLSVNILDTQENGAITDRSITVNFTMQSNHLLYYQLRLYYANGGGPCYIISIGDYKALGGALVKSEFEAGLEAINGLDEPTLIVLPEGKRLANASDYYDLCNDALAQCNELKDRFLIADVHGNSFDTLRAAPGGIGNDNLKYGAAYFPDLVSSLLPFYEDSGVTIAHSIDTNADGTGDTDGAHNAITLEALNSADNALYTQVVQSIQAHLSRNRVVLPPSAAVAGIYARVDSTRGVWKAPANVSFLNVNGVTVNITNEMQGRMNVDTTGGKSVNAIRVFAGRGIILWGARTLAGNDNEWRYVNVRRFFNMVEESVKKATEPFVFEPNDANTWLRVRSMIENFLVLQWRAGALAGAKPEDAFFVRVGLGQTMSAIDILEGRMIVEIGMAVVRPAEFIILRFSHKMQES